MRRKVRLACRSSHRATSVRVAASHTVACPSVEPAKSRPGSRTKASDLTRDAWALTWKIISRLERSKMHTSPPLPPENSIYVKRK